MKRMPRRIFTEEFKKEAVRLFKEQDLTLAEVSRNLDIAPKSLKSWIALYNAGELKGSLGVTKLTPDQLRIRELERELAIAREERDILKKATAYFAKLSKQNIHYKCFVSN
jgi:transposase